MDQQPQNRRRVAGELNGLDALHNFLVSLDQFIADSWKVHVFPDEDVVLFVIILVGFLQGVHVVRLVGDDALSRLGVGEETQATVVVVVGVGENQHVNILRLQAHLAEPVVDEVLPLDIEIDVSAHGRR